VELDDFMSLRLGPKRFWPIISRSPLRGMSNKGQTGWRDRLIVRINTGLSIATIPSFIGRSDRLRTISEESSGRLRPRPLSRETRTHA
jgi:hypothetical protein